MVLDKHSVVALHEREFEAWKALLAGLGPERGSAPLLPHGRSVKDVVAHLAAWQERTVARLEGALHGHAPRFPAWPVALGEQETDEEVDRANAWLLATHRDRPWQDVVRSWQEGYERFLALAGTMPEGELRPGGALAWMADDRPLEGHPDLYDVHHAYHRVAVEARLRESGGG